MEYKKTNDNYIIFLLSADFFKFVAKVNAPVCDPVSVCGHFFIFSSVDAEANDKKPYGNYYKHYPE